MGLLPFEDSTMVGKEDGIGGLICDQSADGVQDLVDGELVAKEIDELRDEELEDFFLDVAVFRFQLAQQFQRIRLDAGFVLTELSLQIKAILLALNRRETEEIAQGEVAGDASAARVVEFEAMSFAIGQREGVDALIGELRAGIESIKFLFCLRQEMLIRGAVGEVNGY